MRLAAIDIGSNAARCLITEIREYPDGMVAFVKLNLLRIPLRLGIDVFKAGEILPEREALLMQTIGVYQSLLKIYGVRQFRACATSAMRDARNGRDIIDRIQKEYGIHIDIISGQEEANILYETHIAEKMDRQKSYLYIDVGGGSTEITLFSNDQIVFKQSFNIGTLRLLHQHVEDEEWERLKVYLKEEVKAYQPVEAIGSGGNINKLFSLSKRKEGKPLTLDLIKSYHQELSALPLEERIVQFNLREDRADVLVPALEIFMQIMRWAQTKEIYVPKIGLADGIIRLMYQHMKEE